MRTVVFDFETNGLLDYPDVQPIQFACLVIDETGIRERQVYIKTRNKLDNKIIEITGITDELLEEKGINYIDFLHGLDIILNNTHNEYLVGHNILNFDIPLAEKILGKQLNKNIIFDTAANFKNKLLGNNHTFNYLEQKKALDTRRKGLYFNLKAAIEYYQIPLIEGDLHNAMTDTKYTYEIYKKQII